MIKSAPPERFCILLLRSFYNAIEIIDFTLLLSILVS